MFLLINKVIKKLLNLGFTDEFGNDLNQKHVVNFSYLVFCASCFAMLALFASHKLIFLSLFSVACLCLGFIGWYYSYKGNFVRAQLLIPIISGVTILTLSFFYFGEQSGFHWLFANIIAYAVVVFRTDQRFIKYSVVAGLIVSFLACEFLSLKGQYLEVEEQRMVITFVFLYVSFYFSVVITLVMSRLKSVNGYLRTLSERDELTGLSNRRKVLADALKIFLDSKINKNPCVFAIIDLDFFKKINDTYGHDSGDLVLAQVATMMRSAIRSDDEIGRYGGEEFIVLMRNTNLKQAEVIIERLRESVENMLIETDKGIVIPVTISAGLAAITPNVSRYEDILVQADKGLYSAKRNGRNRLFIQSEYQN